MDRIWFRYMCIVETWASLVLFRLYPEILHFFLKTNISFNITSKGRNISQLSRSRGYFVRSQLHLRGVHPIHNYASSWNTYCFTSPSRASFVYSEEIRLLYLLDPRVVNIHLGLWGPGFPANWWVSREKCVLTCCHPPLQSSLALISSLIFRCIDRQN